MNRGRVVRPLLRRQQSERLEMSNVVERARDEVGELLSRHPGHVATLRIAPRAVLRRNEQTRFWLRATTK